MHVDDRRFHHVYEDRRDEGRYTVDRGSHVAFSGGPGGIRHDPGPEERAAMHEQHMGRTSFQTQHVEAARTDRSSYFNSNHGRPANVAVARPLAPQSHGMQNDMRQGQPNTINNRGRSRATTSRRIRAIRIGTRLIRVRSTRNGRCRRIVRHRSTSRRIGQHRSTSSGATQATSRVLRRIRIQGPLPEKSISPGRNRRITRISDEVI
jgi:hypothetical protein